MSDMPVGSCPVCDDELDHSDAGFCDECKSPFCWGYCGGWSGGVHKCENCKGEGDECGAMTDMLSDRSRCTHCEHRRATLNEQDNEQLREQLSSLKRKYELALEQLKA